MQSTDLRYLLITAARNEKALIDKTLASVVAQTLKPVRWVVVSDGSTDGTDELVMSFAKRFEWIELVSLPPRKERSFAGKANAINGAFRKNAELDFDIVVVLDADVSFASDYFEFIMHEFAADLKLGVAGSPYLELIGGVWQTSVNGYSNLNHVSGQCQCFRRLCFEEVDGYQAVKGGAIDWIAVTTARMKGWSTKSFKERIFYHHRKMGTAESGILRTRFFYGVKAYYTGGHPLWSILRGFYIMPRQPMFIGGCMFQAGYMSAWLRRLPRVVSPELMAFHRGEQMARLRAILSGND